MNYEETAALLKEHGVGFHLDDAISCKSSDQTANEILIEGYPLVKEVRTRKLSKVAFPSSSATRVFYERVKKSIARPIPPHLLKRELNNRVLLLVNPFSGQKKAEKLWQEYGKSVLEAAEIEVDVVNTECPQHATEIVRSMNIDSYDAILVNSGDGLVTEVLCGLLLRKDRERALKIPICHIPGGTSNALAGAILFSSNEPFLSRDVFITECALFAVRPRYMPLRLCSVETEHNDVKSMFLSACWGLIADIDLGSERFRWAGLARLHIEAIIRILQLPRVAKYKGRISYLPVDNNDLVRKTRIGHLADRSFFGKDHFNSPPIAQATGKEKHLASDFENIAEALNQPYVKIPSLKEPLGKEWTVIEGEFVMVNVTSLSHLGSDLPYIPSTQMGEPILYLTMIDWAILKNRFEVADLFIRMNRGVHLTYPCFQIIPVRAVRVEPLTKTGYFAIDGEPCQSGSAFQVVPQHHCATVIGRKPVP